MADALERGPCPRVAFAADFLARVERVTARLVAAHGRAFEYGPRRGGVGGHDFAGYRAYRAGDELGRIDWALYARTDRPFVRITRREGGARVAIEVDSSASMGVGPPGKLQRAAEVAVCLAALALRERSSARVVVGSSSTPPRALDVDRPARVRELMSVLAGLEAEGGDAPLGALVRGADRRFVISDFLSREPSEYLSRTETTLVRILAPHELGAVGEGPLEWFDPERGERLRIAIDSAVRRSYARELGRELARWDTTLAPFPRIAHSAHSSQDAFEDIVRRSLER